MRQYFLTVCIVRRLKFYLHEKNHIALFLERNGITLKGVR